KRLMPQIILIIVFFVVYLQNNLTLLTKEVNLFSKNFQNLDNNNSEALFTITKLSFAGRKTIC
ncbi:MAG: hypothetical protein L0L10_02220, partial [Tetragenococcus sp.]|nr:hypothetical protein [Tetragenococcus sp.]MDN6851525.1 hypothetical protein [Tetragenococcus koreensis]